MSIQVLLALVQSHQLAMERVNGIAIFLLSTFFRMFIWFLKSKSFSCFFLEVLVINWSISLTALNNSSLVVIRCRDRSFSLVEPSCLMLAFWCKLASISPSYGCYFSDLYFPWILGFSLPQLALRINWHRRPLIKICTEITGSSY